MASIRRVSVVLDLLFVHDHIIIPLPIGSMGLFFGVPFA